MSNNQAKLNMNSNDESMSAGFNMDQDEQSSPIEMALKRRCFEQDNELTMLRDRNAGLTERLSLLRKKSVDFALVEGRNNEQNQKIQELMKFEANLKRELVQVSFKFEEQAKHLEKSLADISSLKNRISELQNQRTQESSARTARTASLENLVSQRDEMIAMLQTAADRQNIALNEMASKYSNFATQLQEKAHSIQLLEAALQEQRDAKDEVYETAQTQLNEITQLKEWLLAREAQIHALENVIFERTAETREFSTLIQKLENELAAKNVDAEKMQTQLKHEIRIRDERSLSLEQELAKETSRVRSDRQEMELRVSQIQAESFELKMASARFQAELQQARLEGERAVLDARKSLTEEMNLRLATDRESFERKSRERDSEQSSHASREIARVAELEVRLRADVERAENRLRSIESQLREDLAKAQSESATTASQLTIYREQALSLRTERVQMEKELAKANDTVTELRKSLFDRQSNGQATLDQSNRDRSSLEGELQLKSIQLEKRVATTESELHASKAEVARMQKALDAAGKNFSQTEVDLKTALVKNRELEMTAAKAEIALEQKTSWFKKQAAEFESETKRVHEVLVNAKQRLSTARTAHKAEAEKNQDLEQALKKARFSLEQKTERVDEQDSALAEAQVRIESLESSLQEANEKFETYQVATRKNEFVNDHKLEKITLQANELEAEVTRLFSELEASQSKLQAGEALIKMESEKAHQLELAMRKQEFTFQQKVERFEFQAEDLKKEVKRLYGALESAGQVAAEAKQAMRIEVEKRENVIRTLESRADQAQGGVKLSEERHSQISIHDKRLRMYAGALTKEKQKIQEMGEKLVEEIQLLSSSHPLVDYVAATEFEISKLELTLKSTPMISPERARLEDGMSKLFEQRDFLRSVLAGSKQHFERQTHDLKKLLASASIPVPPPVPLASSPVASPFLSTGSTASSASPMTSPMTSGQAASATAAGQSAAVVAVPLLSADSLKSAANHDEPINKSVNEAVSESDSSVHWEKPFDQIV